MADNVIDTLSININSNSKGIKGSVDSVIGHLTRLEECLNRLGSISGTQSLDRLSDGLVNLNSTIGKMDSSKLDSVARSMSKLAAAAKSIDGAMSGIGFDRAASGARALDIELERVANGAANTNPFAGLAEGLRMLPQSIPDLSGISALAESISKLGGKKAVEGIANLPLLVSGLNALNGISSVNIPDLTGLANLIATFNKLGGKKGTAAAANIQPMINSIRQLSALANTPLPDGTGLLSLANAFSALGRSTTANAIQNIPQLAQAFRNLMSTLSNAPKVSRSTIALANAMAKLASQGAKVGSASRSMSSALSRISTSCSSAGARFRGLVSRVVDFGKKLLLSGRHANSAGRSYETLASKIGLLYAKFWMLLRAVRGLNGMIEIASHLTEVQNVVDTTFGNMSDKVEKFSKNAIKDFGLSELAAKQTASRFQAMGTAMGITSDQVQKAQGFLNMRKTLEGNVVGYDKMSNSMADMSLNLTKLSADMASFYDVEQSTVEKALQSGVMAGQTRPLRTYGLDLTNATLAEWAMQNGLNANIKSMSQAEKTLLRYQYVMANTSKVQGKKLVA